MVHLNKLQVLLNNLKFRWVTDSCHEEGCRKSSHDLFEKVRVSGVLFWYFGFLFVCLWDSKSLRKSAPNHQNGVPKKISSEFPALGFWKLCRKPNVPKFPGPSRFQIIGSPFLECFGEDVKLICWAMLMHEIMIFASIYRYSPKGVLGRGVGHNKNALEMRQKCFKMRQNGSCFIGEKRNIPKRQK